MQRQLMIIGGHEDKEGEREILREFVRRAGGKEARIALVTAASRVGEQVGQLYGRLFQTLGAAETRTLDIANRTEADDPLLVEHVRHSTGVFFSGGDQTRLTSRIRNTALHEALREQVERGIVLAGTSAGAAAISEAMIVGNCLDLDQVHDATGLTSGLGFIRDVVIDQHCFQRCRLERLLAAVAHEPASLGMGIDENTAAIVEDDRLSVIGGGLVTIVDARHATVRMQRAVPRKGLLVLGAQVYVLPSGFGFDLATRLPMEAGMVIEAGSAGSVET